MDQNLKTLYLTLPWYPGAADTAPAVTWDQWEKNGQATQVTTFPLFTQVGSVRRGTGFVVQLDLGDAAFGPLVHGEIHLKWNMQTGATSASAPAVKEVPEVPVAKKSEAATTPEPEEAFAKYVAGLKPELREQIKTAMTKTHPKPTWTEFHATNLKEAPAGFQPHAPRYDASGKGALTNVKVVPDPVKTNALDKVDKILREANAPKPPER